MGGVEKLGATQAFRQLLPESSISRDAEVQFEGTGQKDRLRASIAHSVLRKQDWPQRAGRWPSGRLLPRKLVEEDWGADASSVAAITKRHNPGGLKP